MTGYDAAVDETARYTEIREELTEDEVNRLNDDLNRLLDMLDERPEIRVTYFVPDKRKSGGSYPTKTGIVRIYAFFFCVKMRNKKRIAVCLGRSIRVWVYSVTKLNQNLQYWSISYSPSMRT